MKGWHPYAHSSQRLATVWLAVLGIFSAWLWGVAIRYFDLNVPWWLDTPAVFGFYGMFHCLFDRFIWRRGIFRFLHNIPDLNGRFDVVIRTSHDSHETLREGTVSIVQSWSNIVIRLETADSNSCSVCAWLSEEPGAGFTLTYVYFNNPKPAAPSQLIPHYGTAFVTFSDIRNCNGSYYAGRGRTNYGALTFKKQESSS